MLFRMVRKIKVSSDWLGCEKKQKRKTYKPWLIRSFLLLSLIPEKISTSYCMKFQWFEKIKSSTEMCAAYVQN